MFDLSKMLGSGQIKSGVTTVDFSPEKIGAILMNMDREIRIKERRKKIEKIRSRLNEK